MQRGKRTPRRCPNQTRVGRPLAFPGLADCPADSATGHLARYLLAASNPGCFELAQEQRGGAALRPGNSGLENLREFITR
jgi:hypothetical protein